MLKKNSQIWMILLAVCLLAFALPLGVFAAQQETAEQQKLTILHMNDTHGRTQAEPHVKKMLDDLRERGENVLLVDAGDRLHGQITTNLTKGASMLELMNIVGYTAMTTGNHDYNFGVDRLLELAAGQHPMILAANVKNAAGESLFTPYMVHTTADGLRVGIFGIATPETLTASDPRITQGLVFEDPAQVAAQMVAELQALDCGFIVALAHLGDSASSAPENKSDAIALPGVDVVIDGHSHTRLENGRTVGGTLIAQTGEYGENIGVVEITMQNGSVAGKTARLVEVNEELPLDPVVTSEIARLDASVADITSEVVGHTPVFLQGERDIVRTGDTNLANLVTDSMRYATGADVALLTGGNIRASIEAGDITMGDVLTTLPFSNLLVTVELSGTQLRAVLEHGVSQYPEPAGEYIQVAGLSFEFDPAAQAGQRVGRVQMADGSVLDADKTYTLATIDFLAVGGDGYTMLAEGQNMTYYGGDAEALVAYLQKQPELREEAEGRVKVAADAGVAVWLWVGGGALVLAGAATAVIVVKKRKSPKKSA